MITKLTIDFEKCDLLDKLFIITTIQEVFVYKPVDFWINIHTDNICNYLNISLEYGKYHSNYLLYLIKIIKSIRNTFKDAIVKFEPLKKEIAIDNIQNIVCSYFNVPVELLQSNTRKHEIVQARQIAMFFSKSFTKFSLATIGSQIGDKDHSTVSHACRTIQNVFDTNKAFRKDIFEIERLIKHNFNR
jgi:hypothetical protein